MPHGTTLLLPWWRDQCALDFDSQLPKEYITQAACEALEGHTTISPYSQQSSQLLSTNNVQIA